MNKKLLSLLTVLLCAFGINAYAQSDAKASPLEINDNEYWWGYWDGAADNNLQAIGAGYAPQQCNVRILIPGRTPGCMGKYLKGVRFTFPDHKNVTNVKIWISTKIFGAPTICNQSVPDASLTSLSANGNKWNEVRFDQPYKIDHRDTFVGYSFDIKSDGGNSDKYPIVVDKAQLTQVNALHMFDSKSGYWGDFKGSKNGDLAMQMLIEGQKEFNSVGIDKDFETITRTVNDELSFPVTVDNRGLDGFSNIDVTIDVNGKTKTMNIKPESNIGGMRKYTFDADMKDLVLEGTSNVKITIDKVNGKPNECADNTMKGQIITTARQIKKKVLVEEFTGLWCGWCPYGIIALEKLRQQFGEDVVLIAYHSGDPMESSDCTFFINSTQKPNPNSHMDRKYKDIYPYKGTGENGREGKTEYGMGNDIKALMAKAPIAEIDVKGIIDGDKLSVTADTRFLFTGYAGHKLAFVVTEDGMQNEKWGQTNLMNTRKGMGFEEEEPLFERWVNGEDQVQNVIFDDIAIAAKGLEYGIDNSLPYNVTAGESYLYTVDFDLKDYPKIQNRENLRVIAFIIDGNDDTIINADCKKLSSGTGVENIGSDAEVTETARYTLDGRRIKAAEKGINIVKYSDGTVKKVIVR